MKSSIQGFQIFYIDNDSISKAPTSKISKSKDGGLMYVFRYISDEVKHHILSIYDSLCSVYFHS